MKNKKFFKIMTFFLIFGALSGCQNKNPSGYTYYSIQDMFLSANQVYVGTLLEFGTEEKEISFSENIKETFISVKAKVIKTYKGEIHEETEMNDWVPKKYREYLDNGKIYLFMTDIQALYDVMGSKTEYIPRFNLYDAVEIQRDDRLNIYQLTEAQEDCTGTQHNLPPYPATLQEAENLFAKVNVS